MPASDDTAAFSPEGAPPAGLCALSQRFFAVRAASERLAEPLSAEDQAAQSMPDASPTKWHLAHTTWFWETFLLTPHLEGYEPFDPAFGYLFNSYYEAIGERHPRPARGLLSRPPVSEVLAYRHGVDEAMGRLLLLDRPDLKSLVELGIAHEEQHQELILMDILHLFAQSPLHPAYGAALPAPKPAPDLTYVGFEGGLAEIGADGVGFAFDNEEPRHKVWLEPFEIASRPVTNAEWCAFMDEGGYERAELWLADGWARRLSEGWTAPLYWRAAEDGWREMGLAGLVPLDPDAPVRHVSYFEADAYATWAGRRLPTEAEWEHASGALGLKGEVWEWTRSPYAPYPGFKPGAGAIGEYNGKFMVSQMVLRGGCRATPPGHMRPSYRNFFYPHQRWMFAGIRLARDRTAAQRPESESFREDVVRGLWARPKAISPKWFYDTKGSALFEEITDLAEYYPTRAETRLLTSIAPELASLIPNGGVLVEFGSGASVKTRLLLDAAPHLSSYVPVDISLSALEAAAADLRARYPNLTVTPALFDFSGEAPMPALPPGPKVAFFPGSTIGNFTREEAVRFLRGVAAGLGRGARFIVGVDLVKDVPVMVAAYDDARGVTAAFNKNLLERMNRELDGDFNLALFDHRAVWNADKSRIEMHLVSRIDQIVRVAGRDFAFRAGETIHTENSHKFTVEGLASLARDAGWTLTRSWVSPAPSVAVALLEAN